MMAFRFGLATAALMLISTPAGAQSGEDDQAALREYARVRARVGQDRHGEPTVVVVGADTIGHWEFAQRHHDLGGEPIEPAMTALYAPDVSRSTAVLITGYVVGGLAVMYGLMAMMNASLYCGQTSTSGSISFIDYESRCKSSNLGAAIGGGGGAAVLLGTLAYHLVSTRAVGPKKPYFDPYELQQRVDRYNRQLRKNLGLPDNVDEKLAPRSSLSKRRPDEVAFFDSIFVAASATHVALGIRFR